VAAPGLIREGRGYRDELNRQTVSDFGKPGAIPVCERSTGDVLDEVDDFGRGKSQPTTSCPRLRPNVCPKGAIGAGVRTIAVRRGVLHSKSFALPRVRFSVDGTYRLRPTWPYRLVVRSWEARQFHVRAPIRTFYLLMFFLVGCTAKPPVAEEAGVKPTAGQFIAEAGHSPPFARMPYQAFSRADAVAIALAPTAGENRRKVDE
jgi:hypothetical protein